MLHVQEIYSAIMGESRFSGWPCVIVRLTGCHRRCVYCDTTYAYDGGRQMTVDQIMGAVEPLGKGILLLTGGEPLMQAQALDLMHAAIDAGRRVVLETGGTQGTAIRLGAVPGAVCRVVDVKTPGSGIAADQVDWEGIGGLTADDEIKMVVIDRRDYEWARDLVRTGLAVDDCRRSLPVGVPVAFSPAWGRLPLRDLAQWILHDGLPVRFQVQLHKVIWPEVERGV